jgi:leukotriene-A4 hydrolase
MKELFKDVSSFSNVSHYKTNHINWFLDVDFTSKVLRCRAVLKVECILANESSSLVLDTRDLCVENVKINEKDAEFKLLPLNEALGQGLQISLPAEACQLGALLDVSICYETSPKAMAIQWLPAEQTLGKEHPYMFTQCQAIHARSLIPCQDSPGCKFTYTAEITVPAELEGLMSAPQDGETVTLQDGRKRKTFDQKVPIPSYLLAVAVGALESRRVGPRSRVWCEAKMVDDCEYEFAKVEDILQTAEGLLGEYVWGEYDMLILPPSFPFGGMENPCLTFLTPTIITGDRSLTSVMIHEITHSWTGNLVTNRKWEDFWLNEGFTRFIEMKINGMVDGELSRQFMAIRGWYSLVDTINDFGPTNKLTALVPQLDGIDPDDAFCLVPYEKGAAFLYYIESLVGGPEHFDPFLKSYIDHYKFKSLETEDFKRYLYEYFADKKDSLDKIDWNSWLNNPGMPPVNVIEMYDSTLADACQSLCDKWTESSPLELDSLFREDDFTALTTAQRISFLSKLYQEKPLGLDHVRHMADVYKMFSYNVSEIKFAFLKLCIRAKWRDSYKHVVKFLLDQGRMKYIRPLYKELFKYEESKELAVETYMKNRHMYHIIAQNMVAKDLKIAL